MLDDLYHLVEADNTFTRTFSSSITFSVVLVLVFVLILVLVFDDNKSFIMNVIKIFTYSLLATISLIFIHDAINDKKNKKENAPANIPMQFANYNSEFAPNQIPIQPIIPDSQKMVVSELPPPVQT